jgi:hypothetical protein
MYACGYSRGHGVDTECKNSLPPAEKYDEVTRLQDLVTMMHKELVALRMDINYVKNILNKQFIPSICFEASCSKCGQVNDIVKGQQSFLCLKCANIETVEWDAMTVGANPVILENKIMSKDEIKKELDKDSPFQEILKRNGIHPFASQE